MPSLRRCSQAPILTAQLPSRHLSADQAIAALPTEAKARVSDADMQQAVRTLLIGLGEDPDREGLIDTPKRVVKALKFLTSGYHQSLDDLLNGAIFHENTNATTPRCARPPTAGVTGQSLSPFWGTAPPPGQMSPSQGLIGARRGIGDNLAWARGPV